MTTQTPTTWLRDAHEGEGDPCFVPAAKGDPGAFPVYAAPASLPNNCDGKEQYAFEAWAKSQHMNMHEHPLHYLFLDPQTDAARRAWSECIRYCRTQALGDAKS
jgi:hypothetical protein